MEEEKHRGRPGSPSAPHCALLQTASPLACSRMSIVCPKCGAKLCVKASNSRAFVVLEPPLCLGFSSGPLLSSLRLAASQSSLRPVVVYAGCRCPPSALRCAWASAKMVVSWLGQSSEEVDWFRVLAGPGCARNLSTSGPFQRHGACDVSAHVPTVWGPLGALFDTLKDSV